MATLEEYNAKVDSLKNIKELMPEAFREAVKMYPNNVEGALIFYKRVKHKGINVAIGIEYSYLCWLYKRICSML
jgi:hypothetical protein